MNPKIEPDSEISLAALADQLDRIEGKLDRMLRVQLGVLDRLDPTMNPES